MSGNPDANGKGEFMGWTTDNGTHEGYAAAVLRDGRWAASYSGGGVIPHGARDEIVPDDQVVGWRVRCDCYTGGSGMTGNWEGSEWVRVASPAETDLAAHRAYSEDAFAPDEVEDALQAEWWELHAGPQEKLAAVSEAAAAAHKARRQLDEAVSAARDAGASWTDVGRAAGISRQSAHERWGGLT
jgi:hypothetical protein